MIIPKPIRRPWYRFALQTNNRRVASGFTDVAFKIEQTLDDLRIAIDSLESADNEDLFTLVYITRVPRVELLAFIQVGQFTREYDASPYGLTIVFHDIEADPE